MKKLFALVLVVCMSMALLSGCSTSESTATNSTDSTYASAMAKTNTLESIQGSIVAKVKGSFSGVTVESTVSVDFKQTVDDGKNIAYQKVVMDLFDEKVEAEYYLVDDVAYISAFGMHLISDISEVDVADVILPDFDKQILSSASSEKVVKGTKYTFTVKGSDIEDYLHELIKIDEALDSIIAEYDVEVEPEISDVTIYYIIDNAGYVCEVFTSFETSVPVEGKSFVLSCEVIMKFDNLGGKVTIELPDFSDYEDSFFLF